MVSEKIRNRLLPIILDKLIELAPGYSGSRISYRDSFRDSLDLDTLTASTDYLKSSQETCSSFLFITSPVLFSIK